LFLELERYDESLKYYNKALEIEPYNQTAIYHRSKVLRQIEKNKKGSFFKKLKK